MNLTHKIEINNKKSSTVTWTHCDGVTHIFIRDDSQSSEPRIDIADVFRCSGWAFLLAAVLIFVGILMERVG